MKKKTAHTSPAKHYKRRTFAFYAVLWILPLLTGILWGPYFDADIYRILRQTRAVIQPELPTEPLNAPLYTLALLAPAALNWPLHNVSLVLSCLGWSLTATLLHHLGKDLDRSRAGTIAALLVASSPLITQTLGSPAAWCIACACIAWRAAIKGRWTRRTVVILALLALSWIPTRIANLVAAPQFRFNPQTWLISLQFLLRTSDFYWFFAPWIVIGAWRAPHRTWWSLGLAILFIVDNDSARALCTGLALWFTATGIDTTLTWLHNHQITRCTHRALTIWGTLLACGPLAIAFGMTHIHTYTHRPLAHYALLQQAGLWMRETSASDATIFAPGIVGYWAERPTLTWERQNATSKTFAQQLARLNNAAPDYCVTTTGLAWEQLTRLRAFRDVYTPVRTQSAPQVSHTVTIWERQFPGTSPENYTPLDINITDTVELTGFQFTPAHAMPGEPLRITLALRATAPVTQSFYAQLSLRSPVDGLIYGQHGHLLPHSTLVSWWKPGQTIFETIPVTPTPELPVGAYHIVLDVRAPDQETVRPLQQDGDTTVLSEVVLGYAARPWTGDVPDELSVNANFGEEIRLTSFEIPDTVTPNDILDVNLYWHTIHVPSEDYTVFVHLLDTAGQLVSSHDGQPQTGRYPTGAWLPGDIVPDTHTLAIPPDLPTGTYRLNVGLYRRPSLERLIARTADGNEPPERALFLRTLTVK